MGSTPAADLPEFADRLEHLRAGCLERGLTFVVLANADRLSADSALGAGRLLDSPLSREFLGAFVFQRTVTLP